MAAPASLAVLVSGSVSGQFQRFAARVTKVQGKSGPFACVLCVGDFFGDWAPGPDAAVLADLPVPVYVLCKASQAPLLPKAAPAATCLTGEGVMALVSGLRVAWIAEPGVGDHSVFQGPAGRHVDVLLSHTAASGFSPSPDPLASSVDVSAVASSISPRYHFAPSDAGFWEPAPYRTLAGHACRFLSLGSLGAAAKQRWLYAMSIVPFAALDATARADLLSLPPGTTASPLALAVPKPGAVAGGTRHGDARGAGKRRRRDPAAIANCWFCLSSPKVEEHLVVDVRDHAYLAVAKGPLTDAHLLLLPVAHEASTLTLSTAVSRDLAAYKDALTRMFAAQDQALVLYERYVAFREAPVHMHIQAIGVPAARTSELAAVFHAEAEAKRATLTTLSDPKDSLADSVGDAVFLCVTLPSGERLVHIGDGSHGHLPMQFARSVLAKFLGLEKRANWRAINMSRKEEQEYVADVKRRLQASMNPSSSPS